MTKMTTRVVYYVPDGAYCNITGSKELCRFCVKHKNGYTCSIRQEILASEGTIVRKAGLCAKGSKSAITQTEPITIDQNVLIDMALNHYFKIYSDLKDQGCPDDLAHALARKMIKGGK